MTRFERLFAPWLAALMSVTAFFLLIAWAEHDPRDGGWWKSPGRDTEATARPDVAGAVVEGKTATAPRAKGARTGRDHRELPAATDGGRR